MLLLSLHSIIAASVHPSLLDSWVFLIIKTFYFISVTLACGGSSAENTTYLELAATTTPPSTNCEYKLCGANANVCRIRFDFEVSLF